MRKLHSVTSVVVLSLVAGRTSAEIVTYRITMMGEITTVIPFNPFGSPFFQDVQVGDSFVNTWDYTAEQVVQGDEAFALTDIVGFSITVGGERFDSGAVLPGFENIRGQEFRNESFVAGTVSDLDSGFNLVSDFQFFSDRSGMLGARFERTGELLVGLIDRSTIAGGVSASVAWVGEGDSVKVEVIPTPSVATFASVSLLITSRRRR